MHVTLVFYMWFFTEDGLLVVWGSGATWVIAKNAIVNFELWIDAGLRDMQNKMWKACFYAIVWSIWELRNKIIFQNKNVSWTTFIVELMTSCEYRISSMKAKWSISVDSYEKGDYAEDTTYSYCNRRRWHYLSC